MEKFKVLEISAPNEIKWIEWDKRDLLSDEVLVKISHFAICTSEQGIYTGERKAKYPVYMGHEVVGEIAEIGSNVPGDFQLGDYVAVSPMGICGLCYNCRKGLDNACLNRPQLIRKGNPRGTGGFAEYMVIPAYQAFKLAKDVDLPSASLAEPVACCICSIDKADVNYGDNVMVVGAGIMGLIHVALAKLKGAHVIISEPNPQRREFALKYGADAAIDTDKDFAEEVNRVTGGLGLQAVLLCGGPTTIIPDIIEACSIGATIVIYTSYQGNNKPGVELDMNRIHYKEVNLVGTISRRRDDFQRAAALIDKNEIDLKALVEKIYPKDQVEEAFAHAIKPDTFRILVRMD